MKCCKVVLAFLVGFGLIVALGTTAQAQLIPASDNLQAPSEHTYHDMEDLEGDDGWVINGQVSYNPNAGPWLKTLRGQDGQGFNADDTGYLYPNSYQIQENLVVGPGPSWTDWHEELLTWGWKWGPALIRDAAGNVLPGQSQVITDTTVDFYFDPLPPGTGVNIQKWIIWEGNPGVQGELFLGGVVQILQYPTVPEPATFVLAAIGLATLLVGYVLRRRS